MDLTRALQIMNEANVAQVPVVENGELIGVLARDRVLHYLHLRLQLGLEPAEPNKLRPETAETA
jgi:predicted transcriptional regulator